MLLRNTSRTALLCVALAGILLADDQDERTVGKQSDGRVLVPTNQFLTPVGVQIEFPGRPVDLALLPDGNTLVAKSMNDLVFLDAARGRVRQILPLPKEGQKQAGFSVVGLLVSATGVLASDAKSHIREAHRGADGRFSWGTPLALQAPTIKGEAHPAGMAWQGTHELWACSTRGNNIQLLDVKSGAIRAVVPVGVAPYMVCVEPSQSTVYVSNWGGDPPALGQPQSRSSETPIRIDPRTGVADHGSVSVVRLIDGKWRQTQTITVGLHPCALALANGRLYVANANSDSITEIDCQSNRVLRTISTRPEARLPFGSGPCALAFSGDRRSLFVANATNNAVTVIDVASDRVQARVLGQIPTGWYPGALTLMPSGRALAVANIKGVGSLSRPRPDAKGMNSRDHLGSVSLVSLPTDDELARHTEQVRRNNRATLSLAGLEPPDPQAPPRPIPLRHGEPSMFKHVIYVIKENRTYDQVFGDLKEGRGMPELTIYGEEITPNQHALAREFTLFDNFYCSGVLSADGHTWVNEAYVGDYIERAFGGFTRSYPDNGADPLAYAPFGFLWNSALSRKKTFRNYGEYVDHVFDPKGATWFDLYRDYTQRTDTVKIKVTANLNSLKPHTHPRYTWWPPTMPDVYRARLFIDELRECEKTGDFPNLIYVTLPCNHAMGLREDYPTPRAMVADNDLALGQIVEAVSKSKFWPETCIMVVEDDPQDGFDHIDAHRTVAQVISPYTRRGFVDHTNYNQTGMVKTIELMLGLPPMNQLDLAATPMRACFQDRPNLTAFRCRPNRVPLDERNQKAEGLKGAARHWAMKSRELDFSKIDAADEDTYNRILWFAARGDTPYPRQHTREGRERDTSGD